MDDRTLNKCIPSLGLAWSNLVTSRFKIRKSNQRVLPPINNPTRGNNHNDDDRSLDDLTSLRMFEICFSPELPNKSAKFVITAHGVCDGLASTPMCNSGCNNIRHASSLSPDAPYDCAVGPISRSKSIRVTGSDKRSEMRSGDSQITNTTVEKVNLQQHSIVMNEII